MDNNGHDPLKEIFRKFLRTHATGELGARVIRMFASGGKALVDKGLEEFPKDFIAKLAADFYQLAQSPEVAEGVSQGIRSFDEERVKKLLKDAVVQLKDSETALMFAKAFKYGLNKKSNNDIEGIVDIVLDGRPAPVRWVAKAFFERFKDYIDAIRGASPEDIAAKIQDLAETLPADAIARQVADLTREMTPEKAGRLLGGYVAKKPTPGAVADIVHGVGETASKKLDEVSAAPTAADAGRILSEFKVEANAVVSKTIDNDNAAKKAAAAAKRAQRKKDGGGGFRWKR